MSQVSLGWNRTKTPTQAKPCGGTAVTACGRLPSLGAVLRFGLVVNVCGDQTTARYDLRRVGGIFGSVALVSIS